MLLQHLLEVAPRVGRGMLRHLFWGATRHDLTALIAPFWTEIDDPVGAANDIEVVLCRQQTAHWALSLGSRKTQKPDSKPLSQNLPGMFPLGYERLRSHEAGLAWIMCQP